MNVSIQTTTYRQCLKDVTALYDRARNTIVETYWTIGKRIVEQEQQGANKADYGAQLIARLSNDLSEKYGRGFSERNLRNMRQFYCANKIWQAPAKLDWTQHVALLPIKSAAARRKLERRVASDKLSSRQIRKVVKEITQAEDSRPAAVPSLPCVRGPLHTYALVDKAELDCGAMKWCHQSLRNLCPWYKKKVPYPRGMVVMDCGFNVWRHIPRNDAPPLAKQSYTYPARVETVVDGDTIWAVIDCGFDTFIREKLRLHRINTPELGTPDGDKARRYVKRVLKASPNIVVRTHSYDKYARYLADIFHLPGVKDPEKICKSGRHLNQELLDKGLARPL